MSARSKALAALATLTAALVSASQVLADEPVTGFVYTTDLLPKDKVELAQWLTWRAHKAVGDYDVVDGRTEVEWGYSDRFQLAGYLNYEWASAYHDNVITGATLAPGSMANLAVGPDEHLDTQRFNSVSVEGIYRFLSPYTDPVGLALYFAPSLGPEIGLTETRLILQKNGLDDRLVFAFNLTLGQEWHWVPATVGAARGTTNYTDHWNKISDVNFGLASSFRFARGWTTGLELQNERQFAGMSPLKASARTNVAYYLGPNVHYAGQHFFATLTYLSQMSGAKDYANPDPGYVVGGRSYAPAFERFRYRAKFGWYF